MTGDRVDGNRIEELRRRLAGPRESERRWAAIELGRMRATSCTAELVARLRGREHETCTARAVLLSRVEDSWGPPDDRSRWIEQTTAALRVGRG